MINPRNIWGSLRNRLAISLIGGAALLTILLFIAVRSYSAQIAQHGQDSILDASVTSILDAAILRDGAVEIDFPYAALAILDTVADDRIFYAIYQDEKLISGYEILPRITTPSGIARDYSTVDVNDTAVRLVAASRTLIGSNEKTKITVAVAQTQDELSGTLNRISKNVALYGAGFFLLAVLLSVWATSTTIAPLKRLTTSVAKRGPQDLSPFEQPVPTEMVPLVSSLNNLMGRLDQSLNQSEEFIAEAAHRVRTPLATVRSYAEATLQRVDKEENRQALRSMVRAIDESSRAAGQLLDHAMISFRADHLDLQSIDLVALVNDLVLRLTPIAEMKDVALQVHADTDVMVQGDPILLQNAVRNLIDNALKFSPIDSVIHIHINAQPTPQIVVLDQGHGFPSDQINDLATRFTRGKNADGIIGSGLGLTIATDVAVAHGGSLHLSNQPNKGGACVTLSL